MPSEEISMGERCEEIGILLEKEQAGELTDEERRRLEAHLASCSDCRTAREGLEALAGALALPDPPPEAGWSDLKARLEAMQRRERRGLAAGMIGAAVFGAAVIGLRGWLTGRGLDPFGVGIGVGIALAIAVSVGTAWWTVRRLRAIPPGEDLVAAIRARLLRRLRALRFFAIGLPAYALLLVVFIRPDLWGEGAAGWVLRIGFVAVMSLLALYGWFVKRPRLVRELRGLEGRA